MQCKIVSHSMQGFTSMNCLKGKKWIRFLSYTYHFTYTIILDKWSGERYFTQHHSWYTCPVDTSYIYIPKKSHRNGNLLLRWSPYTGSSDLDRSVSYWHIFPIWNISLLKRAPVDQVCKAWVRVSWPPWWCCFEVWQHHIRACGCHQSGKRLRCASL